MLKTSKVLELIATSNEPRPKF